MVVTTRSCFLAGTSVVLLDHWGTAKLAAPDDERFFQQTALLQVLYECGTGLVNRSNGARKRAVDRRVMIPA